MKIFLCAFFVMCIYASAEDVTTLTGQTYTNAQILRAEPDGLVVQTKTPTRIVKIPFEELSEDLRGYYGYNAESATWYRQQTQAAQQKYLKNQQAKLVAKQRQHALERQIKTNLVEVAGTIMQKTSDGLLVRCNGEYDGSYISRPKKGVVTRTTGGFVEKVNTNAAQFHGLCLLVGHSNYVDLVDDQFVRVSAFESTPYTYTSTMGASKTVRRFYVYP